MKTAHTSSLLRGLAATVLLTLGFTSISERMDPVMDDASADLDALRVAEGPTYPCNVIEKPTEEIV